MLLKLEIIFGFVFIIDNSLARGAVVYFRLNAGMNVITIMTREMKSSEIKKEGA